MDNGVRSYEKVDCIVLHYRKLYVSITSTVTRVGNTHGVVDVLRKGPYYYATFVVLRSHNFSRY